MLIYMAHYKRFFWKIILASVILMLPLGIIYKGIRIQNKINKDSICLLTAAAEHRSPLAVRLVNNLDSNNENNRSPNARCVERTKVVYIKIHKTGSSTVANILQRFGYNRKLMFALPRKNKGDYRQNYIGEVENSMTKDNIINCGSQGCNILYNHVVFNMTSFDSIFPKDAVYVSLIRDPLYQTISTFLYYDNSVVWKTTFSSLSEYLINPENVEPNNPHYSFTNNRQFIDLGLPGDKLRDTSFINKYVQKLDEKFTLIMITEYFDESLVLLKRYLCWSFKDIIYFRKNSRQSSNISGTLTVIDLERLKQWQLADSMLYKYFLEVFWNKFRRENSILYEVSHFRQILRLTENFCASNEIGSRLIIAASVWNEEFTIASLDCIFLRLDEISFQNILHRDQNILIRNAEIKQRA